MQAELQKASYSIDGTTYDVRYGDISTIELILPWNQKRIAFDFRDVDLDEVLATISSKVSEFRRKFEEVQTGWADYVAEVRKTECW